MRKRIAIFGTPSCSGTMQQLRQVYKSNVLDGANTKEKKMKVDVVLFADSLTEHAGRFSINGIFNMLRSPSVPFRYGPVALCLRIIVEMQDTEKARKAVIR